MATKDLAVKIRLKADTTDAQRNIGAFNRSFSALGRTLTKFTIIGAAVGLVVGRIVKQFNAWIKAANVQEDAISGLNAQLSKLGAEAEGVSKALQDQATALQAVTRFGDEETIAAQTQLAVFAKSKESLLGLTIAAQDFATAQGIDLVTAAQLLGKTLGSSTNALVRYGIEVNGAAGSTDRANSIVNAISTLFAGRATAAANTYAGALAQVANASGDIDETIGTMITSSQVLIDAQKELAREYALLNQELDTTPGFMAKVVTAYTDFKILMVDTARVLNGIEEQQFESIQAIRDRAAIAQSNADFDRHNALEKIELEKGFIALVEKEIAKGKEAAALILARNGALIAAGVKTREELQTTLDTTREQIEIIEALGNIGELSQLQVAEATRKLREEQDALIAVMNGTAISVGAYKASLNGLTGELGDLQIGTENVGVGTADLSLRFRETGNDVGVYQASVDGLTDSLDRAVGASNRLGAASSAISSGGIRARTSSSQGLVSEALALGIRPTMNGTRIRVRGGGTRLLA